MQTAKPSVPRQLTKAATIRAQDARGWTFARGEYEGSQHGIRRAARFIFPKTICPN